MIFQNIDWWANLLPEEQRISLSMDRLYNMSKLETSAVSAMNFAPHLYHAVIKHHALDIILIDNYSYNRNKEIINYVDMIVRVNSKDQLRPEDRDFFTKLSDDYETKLRYQYGIISNQKTTY